MQLAADFSAEILQAKNEYDDIFKVQEDKKLPAKTLYLTKLSFRNKGEIVSQTNKS